MLVDASAYAIAYRLQQGRETDAAIAEHVLGYKRAIVPPDASGENGGAEYLVPPEGLPQGYTLPPKGPIHLSFHAPFVSTDLRAAMNLWSVLAVRGWQCSLVHKPFESEPDERWVFHGVRMEQQHFLSFSGHAKTIQLAICRGAFLSALTRGPKNAD